MKAALRLLVILLITADYHQVMAERTNINEVTDLFDRGVENKNQYLQELESIKAGGINDIETSSGLDEIHGIEDSESEASRLGSIRAVDLQDEGAKARVSGEYSFYDEGEFEPDLSKPANQMHKEDVADIVAGTSKLFKELMGKLKELNVDCKTVKGPIQKEPVFVVEVKREEQKNTEYDQLFCEEPRREYSCTDSLTLNCTRRGIRWHPAQNKLLKTTREEIQNLGFSDLYWSYKVARKVFEVKLLSKYGRENRFKQFVATKIGVKQENIYAIGDVGHHGYIYGSGRDKEYNWSTYYIFYTYRDSYEVCEQWQETWDERCYLK